MLRHVRPGSLHEMSQVRKWVEPSLGPLVPYEGADSKERVPTTPPCPRDTVCSGPETSAPAGRMTMSLCQPSPAQ